MTAPTILTRPKIKRMATIPAFKQATRFNRLLMFVFLLMLSYGAKAQLYPAGRDVRERWCGYAISTL